MFLYRRQAHLKPGNTRAGLEWGRAMCDYVSNAAGMAVNLWLSDYSQPWGTLLWTMWADDLRTFEAMGEKLEQEPGFSARENEGAILIEGGLADSLLEPFYHRPPSVESASAAKGRYRMVTTAVARPGCLEKAQGAAVAIAERRAAITGIAPTVCRSVTGAYGKIHWFSSYDSIQDVHDAHTRIAADPGFVPLVDSFQGCWLDSEAATWTTLYRNVTRP